MREVHLAVAVVHGEQLHSRCAGKRLLLQEDAKPWLGLERMVRHLLWDMQHRVAFCQRVFSKEKFCAIELRRAVQELCRCADFAFRANAAAYANPSDPTTNASTSDASASGDTCASSDASASSTVGRFLCSEQRLQRKRMVQRRDLCELVPDAQREPVPNTPVYRGGELRTRARAGARTRTRA